MIMLVFILGTLLGIVGGCAVCVRYLRHEIAADIGPQLRHIRGKLDNLESALNLALVTRYAELSTAQLPPPAHPQTPPCGDHLWVSPPGVDTMQSRRGPCGR
jgi:hypothetical protein